MAEFNYNIEQLELESLAQSSKITKEENALIGTFQVENLFPIASSNIEVGIYGIDNTLLEYVPEFKGYSFEANAQSSGKAGASIITIDPVNDIKHFGYETGDVRILYNFNNNLFTDSKSKGSFFITEISSDRTEIKALTLNLKKEEVIKGASDLIKKLEESAYFQEFDVNFGENNKTVGLNVSTEETKNGTALLVKLYKALPPQYNINSEFIVEEKISDSLLYEISAKPVSDVLVIPQLKGPNFSLDINADQTQPTEFLNFTELFSYPVSSSHYELMSLVKEKGSSIAINHESYEDFIHFSSVEERLRNFQYKLQLLESYEASLVTIKNTNPSNISSLQTEITGSESYYNGLVKGIVNNFDHYDRYLYFESSSFSWPKKTTSKPYTTYSVTSSVATTWFNSNVTKAGNFDNSNVDILTNTIPTFIREDKSNEPYTMFIHMIAQHFDNLWVYFKAVSDKYDGDHRLNFGLSKDLVREAIESFGLNLPTGNQNTDNIFAMFVGETPTTGSEQITTMSIATSGSFNSGSTALEYMQPVAKNDYEKEVYKRLYHNIPHLLKTKGTERGLRALVNCFGIPESILSIKQFGGNVIETDGTYFGQETFHTSSIYLSGSKHYRSGSSKIRLDNTSSFVSGSTLSLYTSVEQQRTKYTDDTHNVEVGFDISKGVNEFIDLKISGSFDIDDYIGDPRRRYEAGYPKMNSILENIMHDAYHWNDLMVDWQAADADWNWNDELVFARNPKAFVRLLNYFDSSLFRLIKDFVPARAKVDTGIIIKSNKLARSKAKQVEVSAIDKIYSGSISTVSITGSQGGSYDSTASVEYDYTTNYVAHFEGPQGIVRRDVTDESPMFNGELSGSLMIASDGEVGKNNPFLNLAQPLISMNITVLNFSLPLPPACYIDLVGLFVGASFTIGTVDTTGVDESIAITYPSTQTGITGSNDFSHDFDQYEFFQLTALGVNDYGDYSGTGGIFQGWFNNQPGTGSAISTDNPLTIYRYNEEVVGNKYYAKFATYDG